MFSLNSPIVSYRMLLICCRFLHALRSRAYLLCQL